MGGQLHEAAAECQGVQGDDRSNHWKLGQALDGLQVHFAGGHSQGQKAQKADSQENVLTTVHRMCL